MKAILAKVVLVRMDFHKIWSSSAIFLFIVIDHRFSTGPIKRLNFTD